MDRESSMPKKGLTRRYDSYKPAHEDWDNLSRETARINKVSCETALKILIKISEVISLDQLKIYVTLSSHCLFNRDDKKKIMKLNDAREVIKLFLTSVKWYAIGNHLDTIITDLKKNNNMVIDPEVECLQRDLSTSITRYLSAPGRIVNLRQRVDTTQSECVFVTDREYNDCPHWCLIKMMVASLRGVDQVQVFEMKEKFRFSEAKQVTDKSCSPEQIDLVVPCKVFIPSTTQLDSTSRSQ